MKSAGTVLLFVFAFLSVGAFAQTSGKADTSSVSSSRMTTKIASQDTIIIKPIYTPDKNGGIVGYDTLIVQKDAVLKKQQITLDSKK